MANDNPFHLNKINYKRDISILKHYADDQAAHLSIMTGKPYDEMRKFVMQQISPTGEFPFKDPEVVYFERDFETGDRHEHTGTMLGYLRDIIQTADIVAPTLTTYHNPKVRASPLVGFLDGNLKLRKVAKKAMFKAEVTEGRDSFMYKFKNSEQTGRKLANNAVSGAHDSNHNPLFNKTAHSTLTSNCRQTSAYGNTNNERFLAGNRHYWSYDIVRNNIVSIVNHTNYLKLELLMKKHDLHYPSVEETMSMIRYSTDLYWRNYNCMCKIEGLVLRLTPIQRAAFVYTGDMYHLMKFNPDFIRGFLHKLTIYVDVPDPTPEETIHSWPEAFSILASQICVRFTKGKDLGTLKDTDPANYPILASVTKNIGMTLLAYRDVIETLWRTENLPASIAMLPSSLRRVVLASDTDSTIFTVQDWVQWYCGSMKMSYEAECISSAMIFLTSQSIIHILATMSANAGVEQDRVFQISMKNEFKFDVFVLTQIGKHYFAYISGQEGNIFDKYKMEIKGVNLKASNVPKEVVKQAEAMMKAIMDEVKTTGEVSALKYATEVADLERSVESSVRKGEFKYLKLANVKHPDSYKKKELASQYIQFQLWNAVFAPKYGKIASPPYRALKISVELDSKSKMEDWLNSIDPSVANNMRQWLAANGKDKLTTLLLPIPIIASKGVPAEIMQAINLRKIVHTASAMYYLILETLGLYFNHSDLKHLVYDYY